MAGSQGRTPVSIVCVFNDPEVRASCLDRSIQIGLADAPETEYLPVDNTDRQYASAGAALNAGTRRARHDVVVLVHQDVYLHSLVALERAAAALVDDSRTGLVGAVGVTGSGSVAGMVRDRVVMIGRPSTPPVPVDSLDEVLFMVERDRMLRDPLSEHPDLAWHAYAVEYGARVREQGLRVVTADVPLTHNSMTTNLDRLAEAHAYVAQLHPGVVPMHTTCGVVRERRHGSRWRTLLRRRRGAVVWLRESVTAVALARIGAGRAGGVVLADIRLLVDDALDALGAPGVDIMNLGVPKSGGWEWTADGLSRRGRQVSATSATLDEVIDSLGTPRRAEAMLITGVDRAALARLTPCLRDTPHVVGLANDIGAWVLCHAQAGDLGGLWTSRRNAPFGIRPLVHAPARAADSTTPRIPD